MLYVYLTALLLVMHFYDRTNVRNYIFYITSAFLFFVASFRGNGTGLADYDAYIRIYLGIADWADVVNPTEHVEIGFRILSYIGNYFELGGQYIIFMMGLISFVPVVYVINRYSPYKMLSLLVWFPYFMSMNMHSARTSVAVAFGLLFFITVYKKRRLASFFLFALSIGFHTTLALLSAVVLTRIKLTSLILLFVFCFLFSFFIGFPTLFANALSAVGLDVLSFRFLNYVNSEHYGYPMRIYDPRIMITTFAVYLIFLMRNKISDSLHVYFFKIFVIGAIFLVVFMDVTLLAWRLSYIYLIVGVLVVPYLLRYLLLNLVESQRVLCILLPSLYSVLSLLIAFSAQPYKIFLGAP